MVVLYAIPFVFLLIGVQCVEGDVTGLEEKLISAKLGGQVNLICNGITNYRNTVLSFNNTKIVQKPGKFQKLPNGAITILNIQPQDAGEYRYKEISNDSTLNYCIIMLQIIEEIIIVKPGMTVSMSCKVPAPVEMWDEVSWRRKYFSKTVTVVKNGNVSEFAKQNFSGRISDFGNKLVIRNAKEGDSGNYTCMVVLKDSLTRKMYFIKLVVTMPSTIKPMTNELMSSGKSSTSTLFPASSMTKSETRRKSCTAKALVSYLIPVAILTSLLFID